MFGVLTTDRGDVVGLTAPSGSVFASYRYDAWGRPLAVTTQGVDGVSATLAADIASRQPLRYAGYCYDAESGTYYCSARSYDPETMQFLQKDPARADGEESAYQYCGGDPVGKVDPSGLWSWVVDARHTIKSDAEVRSRNSLKNWWGIIAKGSALVGTVVPQARLASFILGLYAWPASEAGFTYSQGDMLSFRRSNRVFYRGSRSVSSSHVSTHYFYFQERVIQRGMIVNSGPVLQMGLRLVDSRGRVVRSDVGWPKSKIRYF